MYWNFGEWPALKRLQKAIVSCGYKKTSRSGAIWQKARVGFELSAENERYLIPSLTNSGILVPKNAVATIRENRLLTVSDKEEDIAFDAHQQDMREAVMSGKDKISLLRSCTCCSAVVVAHIYPSVTGQRQTLTYWTIRRTTS